MLGIISSEARAEGGSGCTKVLSAQRGCSLLGGSTQGRAAKGRRLSQHELSERLREHAGSEWGSHGTTSVLPVVLV